MKKRMILSIDGGGIRGIIPACALVRLEKVTGKLTRETFDLVAGTSTGAIIAAAVAAGIPATEIRDLYLRRAKEVFPSRPFSFIRRVITGSMYSTKNLHRVIADSLGTASRWSLNEAPIDLLLTAKRIPDGRPWYFVKDTPKNARCTGRLNLADCATASAAAPTFFAPFPMPEPGGPPSGCEPVGTLVDGGVGIAGNPVYEACIEAFDYSVGYTPADTIVVSLGTGRYVQLKKPTWIYPWLNWVLGQLLESPEEQQTEIVWRLYRETALYRIDIALNEDIGLDATKSIPELQRYGRELADRIDWEAVLTGTDRRFFIEAGKTSHRRYAHRVS